MRRSPLKPRLHFLHPIEIHQFGSIDAYELLGVELLRKILQRAANGVGLGARMQLYVMAFCREAAQSSRSTGRNISRPAFWTNRRFEKRRGGSGVPLRSRRKTATCSTARSNARARNAPDQRASANNPGPRLGKPLAECMVFSCGQLVEDHMEITRLRRGIERHEAIHSGHLHVQKNQVWREVSEDR